VSVGPTARVPSPPISHASETLPQSKGLESAPSVKTASERPHLQRGLPERDVSPIDWLQTVLAPKGKQVHTPLRRSQQTSETRCKADLPGSKRASVTRSKSQATIPIPSGHILPGRRINRSVQGRPTVPKRHPRGKGSSQRRSQRQDIPAVPAPHTTSLHPVGHPTSGPHAFKAQQKNSARLRNRGPARPRFRKVKGQPVSPNTSS
jgi:hypothetical protein